MSGQDTVDVAVISGGGSRLYQELGVLRGLVGDAGFDIWAWLGISAGGLLSLSMAQGDGRNGQLEALDATEDMAFSVRSWRDVYEKRGTAKIVDMPGMIDDVVPPLLNAAPSIYSFDPMFEKIKKWIDPEKLVNSDREMRIGAYCLEARRYHSVGKEAPDIHLWGRATAAIPGVFEPVKIGELHFIDAGVVNVTPLSDVFDLCRQHGIKKVRIHAIMSGSLEVPPVLEQKEWSALDVVMDSIDIMVSEILNNDLKVAQLMNLLDNTVKAEFIVYQPTDPGIGPLDFEPTHMRNAYNIGRKVAHDTLKQHGLIEG